MYGSGDQKRILAVAGGTMPALVYLHFIISGMSQNIEKMNDRIQRVEIKLAASRQDCEFYPHGQKVPSRNTVK